MREEIEAHELANFKHLAYGHMAKGISWHLPNDIFEDLRKQHVSTINVETIQNKFERYVHTITKALEQLGKKEATVIPKTRHNINSRKSQEHSSQSNSSATQKTISRPISKRRPQHS